MRNKELNNLNISNPTCKMKSSFEGQRNNSEREEINQKMKKQARKR
jgi:hypothetical protein